MSSSRCESDSPDGRRLGAAARRAAANRAAASRWLGRPLLVAVAVVLGGLLVANLLTRPATRAPSTWWIPAATGSVDFLGARTSFRIVRRPQPPLYRLEQPDETAHEHRRLDRLVETFVREAIAALRPGESMTISIVPEGVAGRHRGERAPGIRWTIAVEETVRDGETWFSARPGMTGVVLTARSLEALKETIAREFGREAALEVEGP